LAKFGVDDGLYDFVLSSGQAVFNYLQENNYGNKYYYIGPKKDEDLLDGLNYKRVLDADDADFAVVTGYDDEKSLEDEKDDDLRAIKRKDLTLICVNPDLVVVKQDGRRLICAGLVAKRYQEMQGKVVYFGKPYKMVYDQVFKLFNIGKKDIGKVLAIGDGLETDIKGANDYGLDSAFVPCGIFGQELKVGYGQLPQSDLLNEVCKQNDAWPEYVIAKL
jgi:HAD superfamily hydrolase (TIGR01459 family)